MTVIPAALLTMALGIAFHGPIQGLFGDGLGLVVELVFSVVVFTATKRYLKNLRN